jgi:lipopolysaccharide exporter
VSSLNSKIAKGAAWMVALKASMKVIGLLSTIFLARLLDPEDFGLIAIIMALFAMIEIFGNFSFDTVLIQKQNATPADYNTAWSFNVSFGIVACLVVALSSGMVADFYGDPRIQPVMLSLSGLFLISGFQNIGVVDFRKNMTFEKEFRYQLAPKLISFFVTLGLAFWLRSYWALVFGSLIWRLLVLISGYVLHDFRPRFTFSEGRHLFHFSKWLMINNVFFFLNNRSPELIIGKILSPQAAGFFTIAQEISTMPTSEFAANITAASYPGYCKVSHLPVELKKIYLVVMESIAFFVLPAGVGIALLAHVLVPVVLGPKWIDSIPLIQLLALSGTLIAMSSNTGSVFMALGRPQVSTMMGLLRVVILIPMIFWLSSTAGLNGVAQAILGTSLILFLVSNGLIHFGLKVPFLSILRVYARSAGGTLIMAASVHWLSSALGRIHLADFIVLATLVLAGIFSYAFGVLALWALSGYPVGPESKIFAILSRKFGLKGDR